jgi:hypothetical protein
MTKGSGSGSALRTFALQQFYLNQLLFLNVVIQISAADFCKLIFLCLPLYAFPLLCLSLRLPLYLSPRLILFVSCTLSLPPVSAYVLPLYPQFKTLPFSLSQPFLRSIYPRCACPLHLSR